MRQNWLNKMVVFLIISLFLLVVLNPMAIGYNVNVIDLKEQTSKMVNNFNILYVGGDGPGNYSRIQDAIDNATDGDTVFVFDDSSPYYEHVVINKTINLIGENKNTTIIDGMGEKDKDIITIFADRIKLSGFTIQNASYINTRGMVIRKGNETTITGNIFTNNDIGLSIVTWYDWESNKNIISKNIIKDSRFMCLNLGSSSDSVVTHNIIENSSRDAGITLGNGKNNTITYNDIKNHRRSISLWGGSNNKISNNNIYCNSLNPHNHGCYKTVWKGNYWGRSRNLPKIIPGIRQIYLFSIHIGRGNYIPVYLYMPMIDVDWHPAQEPYDIRLEDFE